MTSTEGSKRDDTNKANSGDKVDKKDDAKVLSRRWIGQHLFFYWWPGTPHLITSVADSEFKLSVSDVCAEHFDAVRAIWLAEWEAVGVDSHDADINADYPSVNERIAAVYRWECVFLHRR